MNKKSKKQETAQEQFNDMIHDTVCDMHSFLFCTSYGLQDCIDAAQRGSKEDMQLIIENLRFIKQSCDYRLMKMCHLKRKV